MKLIYIVRILALLFSTLVCDLAFAGSIAFSARDAKTLTKIVEYKKEDTLSLKMLVVSPSDIEQGEKRVALVLMHGGGWNNGNYKSFSNQSDYFASKGLVVFAINYRTEENASTSPYHSLIDAKSAMRYIRANAEQFSVDPNKIIAGGGSAGGQLAAAVSMCPEINSPTDDLSISSKACATILFNPVVCNGPDKDGSYTGYGYNRVKDYYLDFSPMHNVREGVPPTLFMVGTEDKLIPTEVGEEFKRLITEVGGRCDLILYQGQQHSFYHIKRKTDATYFYKTVSEAHRFLESLGYLKGEPTVDDWLIDQNKGYYMLN